MEPGVRPGDAQLAFRPRASRASAPKVSIDQRRFALSAVPAFGFARPASA